MRAAVGSSPTFCDMSAKRRQWTPGKAGVARTGFMCSFLHMATNLALDDKLLNEALRLGGHRTKKATVTEALQEYIQRRKQLGILELFGKIDYLPDYDYKKERRRR